MAPVRFVAVASKQSIEALINRTRTMNVVLENHARVDPLVAETKPWNWNQVSWDTGVTPRSLSSKGCSISWTFKEGPRVLGESHGTLFQSRTQMLL